MSCGKLEVLVASAKNLKDSDYIGKSDPYVTLSVDGEHTQKTKVIDGGGANPTWDHSFIFNLTEGQKNLYLQVYDSDAGAASADDFIGGTTISLEKLFKSGSVDEWFPLFGDNSKESGSIHLKMKFNKGQGAEFSNLGPEAGPIPTGYGLGAPPPIPLPTGSHHQPPPSHQHSGTTPFPSIHQEHKESRDTKEHKDSKEHEKHETDWVKNAAIAGAAIAGAGALAYAGKKLYDKKHEDDDHEKRDKHDKGEKKDKDHKDKDKKDKHEKEDKKDKDKKDKKDKEHKDKDHKDKDHKDKDKKDKDKKDKKDKHKYDD